MGYPSKVYEYPYKATLKTGWFNVLNVRYFKTQEGAKKCKKAWLEGHNEAQKFLRKPKKCPDLKIN